MPVPLGANVVLPGPEEIGASVVEGDANETEGAAVIVGAEVFSDGVLPADEPEVGANVVEGVGAGVVEGVGASVVEGDASEVEGSAVIVGDELLLGDADSEGEVLPPALLGSGDIEGDAVIVGAALLLGSLDPGPPAILGKSDGDTVVVG